jgi:hypothetical protein
MSIGLLLLPGEGGNTLACTGLIQGLVHSSHSGKESLLLSLCGRCDALSHGYSVLLLSHSGGSSGLLLLGQEVGGDARHGQEDSGGCGGGGWWRNLGLGQR